MQYCRRLFFFVLTGIAFTVSAGAQSNFNTAVVMALDREAFSEVVAEMFRQTQDEHLAPIAERARETRARWDDGGSKLGQFYGVFTDVYENEMSGRTKYEYRQMVKAYVDANPQIVTARVLLCLMYVSDAWEARGDGYANTVSDKGWTGFYNNLETALEYAEAARKMGAPDPELYRVMITIGAALDHSDRKLYGYAADGLKADPTYLPVMSTLSNFLMPKWGGNYGDQKELAEWCVKQTKTTLGEAAYYYIARLVADEEGEGAAMEVFDFDWPRIERAHADYEKHIVDSPRLDQMTLLFACIAEDQEAAKALFQEVAPEADASIWTQEAMDRWRKWAQGEAEPLPYTDLHRAAQYVDMGALQKAVDRGGDLNAMDPRGQRPLDYVASRSHGPAVELILSKGIDPEQNAAGLASVVELAAQHGHEQMLKKLLAMGANAKKSDALIYAVDSGNREICRLLLEDGGCDVDQRDKAPETALARATREKRQEIVQYLVGQGADVNSRSDSGWTPFLLSCAMGDVELMQYFAEHGADPSISRDGWTPLHIVVASGNAEALKIILALGDMDVNARLQEGEHSPLLLAAHQGQVQCAQVLVETPGVDLELAHERLGTPLVVAADAGHYDLVRLLIEKGVDLTATDAQGRSALALAMRDGHDDVAELLREHGVQ